MTGSKVAIFDLDGTLIDSDRALRDAFVRCGVQAERVTFGHVITDECARLGIALDDYVAAYDPLDAAPFDGVVEMLHSLDRWAVASHKDRTMGHDELARYGWTPEAALFTQDFGGVKRLDLVLDALGISSGDALFVGDTAHDRAASIRAGVGFVVAGWNARADIRDGDVVARHPGEISALLG